jgi:membrane protein DedA with SNARE-associated domain
VRRWLPFLAIAETLWTGSLVIIGYYATESMKQIQNGIQYVFLLGSIVFVIFIAWIVLRRYIQTKTSYREFFEEEKEDNSQNGLEQKK